MSSNGSGFRVFVVGGSDADRQSLENSLGNDEAVCVMAPPEDVWTNAVEDCRHANCQVLFLSRETIGNSPTTALARVRVILPAMPLIVFGGPEDEDFRRRMLDLGVVDCLASGRLSPEFVVRASKRAISKANSDPLSAPETNSHETLLSEPLLELSNDGIFAYNLNFQFTVWNSVMERVFDLRKDEVLGRDALEVLPFLRDIDEDEILIAVRNGRTVTPSERPYIHPKTQRSGLFQSKYAPLKDSANKIVGILCVFKDTSRNVGRWHESGSHISSGSSDSITKIPEAEITNLLDGLFDDADTGEASASELIESQISQSSFADKVRHEDRSTDRHRAFSQSNTIENAPIGIWKLDEHFEITKVNATVRRQLVLEDADLIGKSIFDIVPGFKRDDLKVVLDKGERVHLENQYVKADGARDSNPTFWDVAAWPLKGEDDQIVGLCLSTMEVTERQRLLQQKEDFVATLVHDLKTPLIGADKTLEAMINGLVGELDAGQSDVLGMLRRSNQQLLSMVQNLIEVYKYDSKTTSMDFEKVDVSDLLMECISELTALAQQKEISLSATLSDDLPMVSGDPIALKRVFINLLDNAIKFSKKGGAVELTAKQKRNFLEIQIKDTGIGINKADQEKLFQRFWRGENGKKFAVGTGLGLYLCKGIIGLHNGMISVESAEGKGSTFAVSLKTES